VIEDDGSAAIHAIALQHLDDVVHEPDALLDASIKSTTLEMGGKYK
jgi:hypothetical protein